MKAKVVFTAGFRDDFTAQTRRLLEDERPDWAQRLLHELELAVKLLEAAPQAGPVDARRGRRELRRLVLPRLPFLIWYFIQSRPKRAVLLRFFHARQERS
jgi:plasmid stabilization system protein ParE